jgi:hypothetical protein
MHFVYMMYTLWNLCTNILHEIRMETCMVEYINAGNKSVPT